MGKLTVIAAVLTSLAATASPAPSADVLVVEGSQGLADNQRLVRLGDLQLASSADRRILQERVALAIAELCDPTRFSVADPQGSMTCTRQAWTDVQPDLNRLGARLALR
jgi:UrcA family protein